MSSESSHTGSKRKKRGATQGPSRVDRSKRLLDLVMLLLRARAPVPFKEIRRQFPSYKTANIDAGLRAFERDKADLLELGVPLRYISPDEDSTVEDGGYVINLKNYRLPEVHLTADEISALVLAASIARAVPGSSHAHVCDLALRKLAFDFPEPETPLAWPPQRSPSDSEGHSGAAHEPVLVHFPEGTSEADQELSERFHSLEGATRRRKRVRITYQSASDAQVQEREVDPYGLFYRDKSWLVVGRCHLRKEIRSFRLDRIVGMSVAPKPKSPDFERPQDFDVRAYASRSPWTFSPKTPELVCLEMHSEALSVANEDFGADAERHDVDENLEQSSAGGSAGPCVRIRFRSGNPDFIVSRVLAAKGAIRLLEGESCRALLDQELRAIEEMYS